MSLKIRTKNDNMGYNMKMIKLDKLNNFANNLKPYKNSFEVNPLDVNLAKIQFNLTKRLEREIPEFGDFAPVVENYESKDPTLNISTVKVLCKKFSDKVRSLELYVQDRARVNEYNYIISQGEKDQILKAVNGNNFFEECKSVVLKIDSEAGSRF